MAEIGRLPLLNSLRVLARADGDGPCKVTRLLALLDGKNLSHEPDGTLREAARLAKRLGALMSDAESEGFSMDETAQWLAGGHLHPFNEYHVLKGLTEGLARRQGHSVPDLRWECEPDSYERAIAAQLRARRGTAPKPARPAPTLQVIAPAADPD